jgi:hypothetical protein
MSRPLRIQFPQAIYHVMNRGAARQPTFADEGDYQAFLDTGAEAHWLWGIETVKHRVKSLACVLLGMISCRLRSDSVFWGERCCDQTLPEMAKDFGVGSTRR